MCVSNYFLEMFVLLSRGHTLKCIDLDYKGGLDPGRESASCFHGHLWLDNLWLEGNRGVSGLSQSCLTIRGSIILYFIPSFQLILQSRKFKRAAYDSAFFKEEN